MISFQALRDVNISDAYKAGDTVVLVGELFQRSYANGIVDEAKKRGMKVIYSTVGRRDPQAGLRPLNEEELNEKGQPLINVPLEAGFDLECSKQGNSPIDQLRSLKISSWMEARLDWAQIEESLQKGQERFRNSMREFLVEAERAATGNLLFVHTMAGGIPRAKVYMPILNRVFKGTGDRYTSSKEFWETPLGQLCEKNFRSVTSQTFDDLISLSKDLRDRWAAKGQQVRYVAYGYHGTEVLHKDHYRWQSYTPYLQGWAKMDLEMVAHNAWKDGVKAVVFNCPEILTNSSSVFQGVEISLYALISALQREGGKHPHIQSCLEKCKGFLKPQVTLSQLKEQVEKCLATRYGPKWNSIEDWPHHSTREQLEEQLQCSDDLSSLQTGRDNPLTSFLSELIFSASGSLIIKESWNPRAPVLWLGHDVIASEYAQLT